MFLVEAPLYVCNSQRLIELAQEKNIRFEFFGAYPFSPFNGGRLNVLLDGFLPPGYSSHLAFTTDVLFGNRQKILSIACNAFIKRVEEINRLGFAFNLVCSNMFFSYEEITLENMVPIELMAELGQKYGVRNGIIIYNPLLEDFLRRTYPGRFNYISSCTKYYRKDVVVDEKTAVANYLADVDAYDFVVLTPQHSRHNGVMAEVVQHASEKFMVVSNVTCSKDCTSFWHFDLLSRNNKTPLMAIDAFAIAQQSNVAFQQHGPRCMAERPADAKAFYRELMGRQIKAGVKLFKIGRISDQFENTPFEQLVNLLQEQAWEIGPVEETNADLR